MKKQRTESQIFFEMINAMTQAIGASSQLIHGTGQPVGFMIIRDTLFPIKEVIFKMAPENRALQPKTIWRAKK